MYGAVFGFVKVSVTNLRLSSVYTRALCSVHCLITVLDALPREIRRFQLTWNRASLSAFTMKRVMLWTEATIEDWD